MPASISAGPFVIPVVSVFDHTIGIVYNLGEGNDTVDLKGTALENMNLEGSLTLKEETVQLKDGKLEMPPCSIVVLK